MSYLGHMGVWEKAGYRCVGYRYDSKSNSTKPKMRWAFHAYAPKVLSKDDAEMLAHAWTNAAFNQGGYKVHWQDSDAWHVVQRKYLAYLYKEGSISLWRYLKDRIHLEIAIAWGKH